MIATSTVLSVVLALSGAGSLALAGAGCGHSRAGAVVSASGRVGKLRIDRSTAADVRQLAGAQALRTCADRWNQGNMVSWGPTFAGVAFRRPNAYERTYLGVPDRPQCFVVLAVSYKRSHPQEPCADHPFPGHPQFCFRLSQTYSCVMERSGAYVCPTNAEGSPPLRKQNGTVAGYGVLTLRISLAGTHATRPLAWQRRYPRVDGFVEPWTSGGILRPGLRFKGEGHGRCFLVAETIRSAISCLTRTGARYNACFPQHRDWGAGDLAACGAPGGTTFVRWRITRRF